MKSIRKRILVRVLGLLLVSTLIMGWASHHDSTHEVEELFDAQLGQSARVLIGLLGASQGQIPTEQLAQALLETSGEHPKLGHRYESKLAFQVRNAEGRVIARSFNVPPLTAADWKPGFADLQQAQHQWRSYVLESPDSGLAVWVGERSDVRGELVDKIVRGTLVPDLLGIPLLVLLVWFAIGSGLKPLDELARLIRLREPNSLQPIVLSDLPQELEPVQAALNRMLEQLHQLLAREQRFIADAAHELRTPLAVLKIHAENAMQANEPAERDQALQHLRRGVERATRLISQMLTLARLADDQQRQRVPVALLQSCRDAVAELLPLALRRDQELELVSDGSLPEQVEMEPGSLGMLLQNLVGNAIQHTPDGGRILISLQQQADQLVLRVEDSGSGVAPADRERLLERFHTQGNSQGAGLGLSIVQRIIERHQGSLLLGDSPLGGLLVQASFPLGTPVSG
ncbi:MAG: two-component sensor histidine kinase [Pseudomonadales bacterium]|jgi:two-component system sensor histidine kinase QseC|uniref:ATP-binding protein n=1 Tax=Halopseudomonas aestusnigri TaxID=857252 RepID=UPI000C3BD9FC|nr:ATP-binding protein [Halopseudomonas aestusnigri]MAD27410.1 two-component sensor histidine kinase [Pseudomonadales bacterium]MAD27687.1 two-component sensor histidine kinase [Pseudomonadales bacterium]MAH00855.1 two-component sensor histidine kinase [Pseudomonadales bacterium]MBP76934.1 two-component sensor histidine kinase [Pseudomonadales bacterium]MCK5531535.1 sensor histidine kinase N-terminal domain-containing protein [Halopseudomonas aestusnigri]